MQNFTFNFKGKKFNLEVKKLSGIRNFTSGLMFSSRERAKALVFDFKKPEKFSFTGLFVFFPFVIIFLDEKNNVLEMKKIKPFQFHIPSIKSYFKVLEIPCNESYSGIIKSLVEEKV